MAHAEGCSNLIHTLLQASFSTIHTYNITRISLHIWGYLLNVLNVCMATGLLMSSIAYQYRPLYTIHANTCQYMPIHAKTHIYIWTQTNTYQYVLILCTYQVSVHVIAFKHAIHTNTCYTYTYKTSLAPTNHTASTNAHQYIQYINTDSYIIYISIHTNTCYTCQYTICTFHCTLILINTYNIYKMYQIHTNTYHTC